MLTESRARQRLAEYHGRRSLCSDSIPQARGPTSRLKSQPNSRVRLLNKFTRKASSQDEGRGRARVNVASPIEGSLGGALKACHTLAVVAKEHPQRQLHLQPIACVRCVKTRALGFFFCCGGAHHCAQNHGVRGEAILLAHAASHACIPMQTHAKR